MPFFIYNSPFAQGGARGDRIKPLKGLRNVRLWHILVVPKIKVSTPLYIKNGISLRLLNCPSQSKKVWLVRLTRPKYNVKILTLALKKNDLSLIGDALFNSLEQVTARLYPQINAH